MAGFLMGFAKGATPRASSGKTQLSFAEQVELNRLKAEEERKTKRTLDPSGPTSAKITAEYGFKGTKYQADRTFQGITEKGNQDVRLKTTVDATEMMQFNKGLRLKRANNYYSTFKSRTEANVELYGRHHTTLPTFDEVQAVMSAGVDHSAYHFFNNKGWFSNKATQEQIKNGKAHYTGFILGTGGSNGGFATESGREKFDNASSQMNSDLQFVDTVVEAKNTPDSIKAGFVFNRDTTLNRSQSKPVAKAIYDRVSNFIIPTSENYTGKEFKRKALERYMANNENKQDSLKGLLKRKNAKQIAEQTEKPVVTSETSFVEKGKTVNPVENIITAKAQFSAGPGSKRYKTVADQVSKKGSSQDRLYQAVLNRAIETFTNPKEHNRYSGAVNFAKQDTDFAKKQIAKGRPLQLVGTHLVGFAKTHKVNDDSYLQSVFEGETKAIIPSARELDMIVTTAIGEAEEFSKVDPTGALNIDGLDHVLEIIRNRLYHPDFAKQRKSKVQKLPAAKKGFADSTASVDTQTKENTTSKTSPIQSIPQRLQSLETGKNQVKNLESIVKSKSNEIEGNHTPEIILEAFKSDGDYTHVYTSAKFTTDEDKAKELVRLHNLKVSNKRKMKDAATLDKDIKKKDYEHMLTRDKEEIVKLEDLKYRSKIETKDGGFLSLPRVQTKEGSRDQLLALKNQSILRSRGETETKALNPADAALAEIGRWETWVSKVNSLPISNGKKDEILTAFTKRYGSEILYNLNQLANIKGITKGSFALVESNMLPEISKLKFNGDGLTGETIINNNFKRTNEYVKFYNRGGIKGTKGDYAFVKKEVGNEQGGKLTLVYPVLNRTQEDIDQNGVFKSPQLLVPNRDNRLEEITSGTMTLKKNKYIRMLDFKSEFFLKNNPERAALVNNLLKPLKNSIRKAIESGSGKDAQTMVNEVLGTLGQPNSELRKALGEYYQDFDKEDLVKTVAFLANNQFHFTRVLSEDQQVGVGGINLDTLGTNSQYGYKTQKEIDADLSYKDAKMVSKSSDIVIRYMKGLLNVFKGIGANRVNVAQVSEIMSPENAPSSNFAAAKQLISKLRLKPEQSEKIINESFDNEEDRERMKSLLGREGASRAGGMFNAVDYIINKVKQGSALAKDLIGYEGSVVDTAKRSFTIGPKGANAVEFIKEHGSKLADLEERKNDALKKYDDSFKLMGNEKDELGRTRTERILNARRNLYAIALTYHFAGLVQGGSGGRAISNEDFQNLYEALFGSDGPVQYSNIKSALSIAQNALYKADIVIAMRDRKGQADFVLKAVNPVLDAITHREEQQALVTQAKSSTMSGNPSVLKGNVRRLGTFTSKTKKGRPTNNAIEQQESINTMFDQLGFDMVTPNQFLGLAEKAGVNPNKIQDNITAMQFYQILDQLGEGISTTFDYALRTRLQEMNDVRFDASTELKKGMNAIGLTMSEIFQRAANPKENFQKEYQQIKGSFLTSYVREFVDRLMTNRIYPALDEPQFGMQEGAS